MKRTTLEFLIVLKRRLGALPDVPGLRDPLGAIVEIVNANPDTPEAKTLGKIVNALWTDSGGFDETEIYSLDHRSLALVEALAEDRVQGRYSREEWIAGLAKLKI